MNELLDKLDKLWNSSNDERYKGENPACNSVLDAVESKFKEMADEEIIEVIESISENQREQLFSVFEDLVDDKPFLQKYM